MLASEFIKTIQEAGFTYEKVTKENLANQPNGVILTSPGFRVNVGINRYLWSLENIGNLSKDSLDGRIHAYKQEAVLEADFATVPEKG